LPDQGPAVLLVGSEGNELFAFRLDDGKEAWRYETDSYVRNQPVFHGGEIILGGCDNFLHVIDARTGDALERFDVGSQTTSSPLIADSLIAMGLHRMGVTVRNLEDMATRWEQKEKDRTFYAKPGYAQGVVVTAGDNRVITGLDAITGDVLWQQPVRKTVTADIAVKHGIAFVGSEDERLYVLRISDGQLLAEMAVGGKIKAAPIVTEQRLFVLTDRVNDGQVLAFDLSWQNIQPDNADGDSVEAPKPAAQN
jgi:outer membrane protein assembly factor BamB